MIKGKTKSGIKFQINETKKDDVRTLYYITEMEKATEPLAQSRALFELLTFLFNSKEGMLNFMDEVANAHDGNCSPQVLTDELIEILNIANLKNS